jgi:hypothetical protein
MRTFASPSFPDIRVSPGVVGTFKDKLSCRRFPFHKKRRVIRCNSRSEAQVSVNDYLDQLKIDDDRRCLKLHQIKRSQALLFVRVVGEEGRERFPIAFVEGREATLFEVLEDGFDLGCSVNCRCWGRERGG